MTTKIIPLILTLCTVFALDATARYRGDLNGDDRVDLADMVYLAKAIKAGSTDKSLDVNASGKVDDFDLQKLADIIISGKLNEDSGMNVGIGGWDDTGEDFGGTVKAPAFTTRSTDETRFYMHNPKSEGNDQYYMELGISDGNEAPAAILFNIHLPREMSLGAVGPIDLDPSISSSHRLYGTPKFIMENEDDEWSARMLRFIILSPDLNALPVAVGKIGNIHYSVSDCWGEPYFKNCQVAGVGGVDCIEIPEHWGGYSGNFMPVELSSVWFDQTEMNLVEGDEGWLYANIDPWDATDQNLVWTSSDENVATVYSDDGKGASIKAIKEGEAVITATASNGLSASCTVHVEKRFVEVWGIYFSQDNITMTEGDSTTLTATIDPADATDQTLAWSSSDDSIAIVDPNGKEATVTSLAPGYVEIYASASNGMTATCHINVEARYFEVTEIVLDQTELNLIEGDRALLTATVSPEDATDKSIAWSSSNIEVAAVSEAGEITAVASGEATITATSSSGLTADCHVTVAKRVIAVSEVILDKTSLEMTEGDVATLTATINPADATDKTLTWTSSDASVASVSSNGEVKALKPGTATITVSSTNGKTASCEVIVVAKEIEMESIILDTETLELEVGDTHQFVATVLPAETTDTELEWWVDDETVAVTDRNGFVTMVGEGSTTVHVRSVRWNHIEATCHLNVKAGVEGIIVDDAPCDIYSPSGILIRKGVRPSEIEYLDPGLYLIRQRGKTTKLLK
ncbi:MAG: Ig-like domain-containing protein [Muribaculaceae bacterium]|nr:Ig-like domain-containing protein [Muribaculaceae bacterium]